MTSTERIYQKNQDELTKLLRNALWAIARKGTVEEKAEALREYLRTQGPQGKLLILEIWQNPPAERKAPAHANSSRSANA